MVVRNELPGPGSLPRLFVCALKCSVVGRGHLFGHVAAKGGAGSKSTFHGEMSMPSRAASTVAETQASQRMRNHCDHRAPSAPLLHVNLLLFVSAGHLNRRPLRGGGPGANRGSGLVDRCVLSTIT